MPGRTGDHTRPLTCKAVPTRFSPNRSIRHGQRDAPRALQPLLPGPPEVDAARLQGGPTGTAPLRRRNR